jgi:hypothetical protein
MKTVSGICICMLCLLASCYPYKKVSSNNFRDYDIPKNELEHLHYVLKKKDLHYVNEAEQNNYNIYNRQDGSLTDSQRVLIKNNLVIPKGATGKCVHVTDDQLLIDFGEGVVIPFILHANNNSPATKIRVDQRSFGIKVLHRSSSLYIDVSSYSKRKK